MEKFITPRGSGRTYQICKYAIEHDCDIIVPMAGDAQHIITVIMRVCADSNGELIYGGLDAANNTVDVVTWNDRIKIHIYDASNFSFACFGSDRRKPVVIDDIDECMKRIINSNLIAAVSMCSYDPADVALHPEPLRQSTQFQCRNLI